MHMCPAPDGNGMVAGTSDGTLLVVDDSGVREVVSGLPFVTSRRTRSVRRKDQVQTDQGCNPDQLGSVPPTIAENIECKRDNDSIETISIHMRLLLLVVLSLFFASAVFAQDAKLIAEGKKEGKVVIYGSMEQDIFEGVQQAFEKKTGITVEYWRASGAAVLERVITERRAGKAMFDVVLNNAGPMEIMLADGAFVNYQSPLAKNFPPEFVHPQLGPSYRTASSASSTTRASSPPTKRPKPSKIS